MSDQRGVATIEWIGLVLVVSAALGAAAAVSPVIDGRSFGGFLAHAIVCAASGGCDDGDGDLAAAYGANDAELVRRYAPNLVYERRTLTLPVDYRECRSHRCSDASGRPGADVHLATRGHARATVFTRLVRDGGETFIQYWLYYPDSTSTFAGSAGAWRRAGWVLSPLARALHPQPVGYHPDDWESYQVRLDRGGRATVRSSSHGHYQGCGERACRNRWVPFTGWTRVSYGSHAGHIPTREGRDPRSGRPRLEPAYPGVHLDERTTTSAALRLVPIERVATGEYRRNGARIVPPWEKEVYRRPRSDSTG